MKLTTPSRLAALLLAGIAPLAACSDEGDSPLGPLPEPPALCASASALEAPTGLGAAGAATLPVIGLGAVPDRLTSELWVRGSWAYTGTYGSSRGRGNVLKVWDVSGGEPVLRNEVTVEGVSTLGDVQASDDGRLLVVATEYSPGSIVVFDLSDPERPSEIARFASASTRPGVHTATLARVDGRLHAFLAVDPSPSQLVIVDLSDPANPREVLAREMGDPFIHDVFVREGLLFTALWNEGTVLWDIGGGGEGGSVSDPVRLAVLRNLGGHAHNVWWSGCSSTTISPRYVFVGEENAGGVTGVRSSGDVHVLDIGDLSAPREVAFFTLPGAGTHNFSVDEESGVLYAAYYNGGVRALDVGGDLSACAADERGSGGRCDLWAMGRLVGEGLADGSAQVYVWGVHWQDGRLFASDMLNGLWALDAAALRRR